MFDPPNRSLEPPLQEKNCLIMFVMLAKGPKNGKERAENCRCRQFSARFLPFLGPLASIQSSPNNFFLVEEVPSFDLVGQT